jgi:hypothetical protein
MSAVTPRTYKAKRRDSAWDKVKRKGSKHYKSGKIEPIDLFRSGDLLWGKCITDIIKYAFRNKVPFAREKVLEDMDKIIHYAEIAKAIVKEEIDKQLMSKRSERTVVAMPCVKCAEREQQDQIDKLMKGAKDGSKPDSKS